MTRRVTSISNRHAVPRTASSDTARRSLSTWPAKKTLLDSVKPKNRNLPRHSLWNSSKHLPGQLISDLFAATYSRIELSCHDSLSFSKGTASNVYRTVQYAFEMEYGSSAMNCLKPVKFDLNSIASTRYQAVYRAEISTLVSCFRGIVYLFLFQKSVYVLLSHDSVPAITRKLISQFQEVEIAVSTDTNQFQLLRITLEVGNKQIIS